MQIAFDNGDKYVPFGDNIEGGGQLNLFKI